MTLVAVVFLAGILHGLGPDHLAAISVFGSQGKCSARQLTWFSARFALGHAAIVALAGLVARAGRELLSARWEAGFDVFSGVLLIITGIVMAVCLRIGVTVHTHSHPHEHSHAHFHLLAFASDSKFPLLLGGFFALGGFRALLAVIPIALAPTAVGSFLRILTFAVGIVLSMTAYGLASDTILKRYRHRAIWPEYIIAAFSVVAGILTLSEHWK